MHYVALDIPSKVTMLFLFIHIEMFVKGLPLNNILILETPTENIENTAHV